MKKFTQRALIVGAAEIAMIGAVGVVNLLGPAQADPAPCMTAAGVCDQQGTGPNNHVVIACEPIGPKAGATCREVGPHSA